ncbi:MAG: gas vesicle protein K [Thermoleophilaceae bacterium]
MKERPDVAKLMSAPLDLDPFRARAREVDDALTRRINADPESVERGLAQLVLTVVELLRQLMERQALRRIETDTLDDEEVERMGQTFMALEQRMQELLQEFELEEKDLNINLGPLGNLL